MSTLQLSGVNSRFFSAIPLSRFPAFHLKCPAFFLCISSWKKCALCTLLSVKWNSDDSATSFQCLAKLIRCVIFFNFYVFCLFVKLRLSPGRIGPRDKDIPGYRNSGTIRVASIRCTKVSVAPLAVGKNTNSRFLCLFVRSVKLFRSLMLT